MKNFTENFIKNEKFYKKWKFIKNEKFYKKWNFIKNEKFYKKMNFLIWKPLRSFVLCSI